jgi:CheY-like chemotaxis protein
MPKVLIVEDNEENRDSLSRRLERRGYTVVLAADGKAGVALAQSERPDLILMDMNMPELDGWEATRQIKAIAGMQNMAVLALTAHALAEDRERALQAGCADYHTKPVDFPKLLAQMEAILQGRSATTGPS